MTEQEIIEQVYICASCGYCRFGCPIYNEKGFESLTVRGRMQILKKIIEGKMKLTKPIIESMYMCAQCQNCNIRCPTGIDFVKISEAIRETLMKEKLAPEVQQILSENLAKDSNPFREPLSERGSWLPSNFPQGKKSENLYFVGCTGSYSLNRIPKSIMRVLDSIGFDYTLLGSEERCCGSPILRVGDRETAIKTIERNVEQFKKLGVKTVITSCAGCHTTLLHHYPPEFKYVHFTQLFAKLIKEGVLVFEKELNEKVIYFDGCDLGRHSGIYEEPREILRAIPGVELVEFQYNREEAECCGGPILGADADLARKIGATRVQEAIDRGATLLVTACPTCLLNFKEGARIAGLQLQIQDLALLLPKYVKAKKKE
jgi:Fe-S oxidoreductase